MEFFEIVIDAAGLITLSLMVYFLFIFICQIINDKIRDIKDQKKIIKAGTIMFLDGRRLELKRDLYLRFKKKKVTMCECEQLRYFPRIEGYSFENIKDFAQSDFENNLLQNYKVNKEWLASVFKEQ